MFDRLLKRTTEIQNALTVLMSELHQLRALMGEPVGAPAQRVAAPPAPEPVKPAREHTVPIGNPLPEIIDDKPRDRPREIPLPARPNQKPAQAQEVATAVLWSTPQEKPQPAPSTDDDLVNLLERSAWEESDQPLVPDDDPIEFEEHTATEKIRGSRPGEQRPTAPTPNRAHRPSEPARPNQPAMPRPLSGGDRPPGDDIAELLEGSGWSGGMGGVDPDAPPKNPSRPPEAGRRARTQTSREGLEALLTGYLDENEK